MLMGVEASGRSVDSGYTVSSGGRDPQTEEQSAAAVARMLMGVETSERYVDNGDAVNSGAWGPQKGRQSAAAVARMQISVKAASKHNGSEELTLAKFLICETCKYVLVDLTQIYTKYNLAF
jgi:hypothetical protein